MIGDSVLELPLDLAGELLMFLLRVIGEFSSEDELLPLFLELESLRSLLLEVLRESSPVFSPLITKELS